MSPFFVQLRIKTIDFFPFMKRSKTTTNLTERNLKNNTQFGVYSIRAELFIKR